MRRAAKYAGRAAHIPHGKAIYIGKDRAAAGRPREGTLSKSNLYQTAAYVTAFSVAEKFFGFLYRIILSRTLGAEGMGIYQVALSVFAVLATAAASGIPLTVSRLITKYRAQKNSRAQHSVVTAALLSALCFSVPVFCILFFGHKAFDFLFSDPRCMTVLLILLPSLTFNSVYSVLRGELWGNKRFVPYCVIDLIEELCMIGAGVLLVTHMSDLFDGARRVALAVVFSYLVSFTLSVAYFFIKGGKLRDPRGQLRPLLASALPITGMRTSGSLINSAISLLLPARLIAAGFTSEQAMSEIGIAMGMSMPILSIPSTLIGSLALVMIPELAENFFRGDHIKLRENIEKALKVTSLIACLLIPPLFALGKDIGILLFSSEHGGEIIRNCCFMLFPHEFGHDLQQHPPFARLRKTDVRLFLCRRGGDPRMRLVPARAGRDLCTDDRARRKPSHHDPAQPSPHRQKRAKKKCAFASTLSSPPSVSLRRSYSVVCCATCFPPFCRRSRRSPSAAGSSSSRRGCSSPSSASRSRAGCASSCGADQYFRLNFAQKGSAARQRTTLTT